MHDYWTLMKKLIWLRILQGASFIVNKITGTSPITLTNAINSAIISLTQYGKCVQDGTSPVSIICNNGTLKWDSVNQRIYADGTPEVVTLSASGVADQTATVENLFAVDNIADEQDIITGKVIRRTEAVVSDGTTPSGRYVGEVGEGNIIIKARETGYSGEIASFTTEEETPLTGLRVNFEPIQDLHGYDAPWPSGGGKNKCPFPYITQSTTINDVAFTANSDGSVKVVGTASADAVFYLLKYNSDFDATQFNGMVLSGCVGGSSSTYFLRLSDTSTWSANSLNGDAAITKLTNTGKCHLLISVKSGVSINTTFYPMIRASGTSDTFVPYSNICPISGHTDADVIVSPTLNPSDGTTYPIPLGTTVYGGTLDVLTGVLTVTHGIVSDLSQLTWTRRENPAAALSGTYLFYAGITEAKSAFVGQLSEFKWVTNYIYFSQDNLAGYIFGNSLAIRCDTYTDAISFTAAMSGVQLVYELATPIVYQLSPQAIETLRGLNNVWSNGKSVNVYVSDGELIVQVTPQKLKTAKGTNVVEVTSNVDPVTLEVEYKINR